MTTLALQKSKYRRVHAQSLHAELLGLIVGLVFGGLLTLIAIGNMDLFQ